MDQWAITGLTVIGSLFAGIGGGFWSGKIQAKATRDVASVDTQIKVRTLIFEEYKWFITYFDKLQKSKIHTEMIQSIQSTEETAKMIFKANSTERKNYDELSKLILEGNSGVPRVMELAKELSQQAKQMHEENFWQIRALAKGPDGKTI